MSDFPRAPRPPSRLAAFVAPALAWRRYEWHVLLIGSLLLVLGMMFVRSMALRDDLFLREAPIRFDGHLKKALITVPFVCAGLFVRSRWLRRRAFLVYALTIAGLVAVEWIGEERNNARRWIPTPIGFDIQPSEFAKLGLIIALARVLALRRPARPRDFVLPVLLALLPMALVAKQPDLGTALTMVPVTLGMLYLAGANGRGVAAVCGIGLLVGAAAWEFRWVQDYQLRRIDTWAASFRAEDLIAGQDGPAFHVYHARVAIGNGGLSGTGIGQGIASTAGHLPERESDSIFCVIAEEAGFVGATAFLVLYALMIGLLLRTAGRVRERYTRLVVGGVALYFAAHYLVNVGVNLGLLPMTGLTLPLLSTGGSSLLASSLGLGLALGLAAQEEPSLDESAFQD
jgi:rod shape determining protein RodA